MSGELKNIGDKTLKEVEITIYCPEYSKRPIHELKRYPVLVTSFSFGDDNTPLKPNYARAFSHYVDAPKEWSGRVTVRVTVVEFQSDRGP